MDLYNWYWPVIWELEDEAPDLANQLQALDTWVCDGDHERIDAVVPGLIATLESLNQPWLDLYVRHWQMQSRVLHRYDVRGDTLKQCVDLLERASRPNAAECPMSICAAQDFCAAHGILDGPGFAEQRVQVCDETLARITRKWPCWRCITTERAEALQDHGRSQEALDWILQEQGRAPGDQRSGFESTIVRLLLDLARPEQALKRALRRGRANHGISGILEDDLQVARCLAHCERWQEAAETLPSWSRLEGEVSTYPTYLDTLRRLIEHEAVVWDVDLSKRLLACIRTLHTHCAHRHCTNWSITWAEAALQVGQSIHFAKSLTDLAESSLSHLRDPMGADQRVTALRRSIAMASKEKTGNPHV